MQDKFNRETALLIYCFGGCKMGQLLWKIVRQFFSKLKIDLPHGLPVTLLAFIPEK